jgi:hypothetical protein
MIGWIISFAALAGGFLFMRLARKYSVAVSILFGAIFWFGAHFLFDTRAEFKYTVRAYPEIYFLIDKSASCTPDPAVLDELISQAGGGHVYYFANTISRETNSLNPQFTVLFDAVRTLLNTIPPNSRIVIVSDFLDNASLSPAPKSGLIYPVITPQPGGELALYRADMEDYYQSGEPVKIPLHIYSKSPQIVTVSVLDNGKPALKQTFPVKAGMNILKLPLAFHTEGFRTVTVSVNGSGGDTNNYSVTRIVNILPSYYKILVVCGRPSPEYAAIKRFLEQIRWVSPEFHVMISKSDTYTLDNLAAYQGILLMDLSDYQLKNTAALAAYKNKIFYQPGLKRFDEIPAIFAALSLSGLKPKQSETKFSYNNQDLVVKTSFERDNPLFDTTPNIRVFLGWDSWKWDFITLSMGINMGVYADFWRNQLNFIIGGKNTGGVPDKLNYFSGEKNPSGKTLPGIYLVSADSMKYPISVQDNPAETAMLPPDTLAAKEFNTNAVEMTSIDNVPAFLSTIRGADQIERTDTVLIAFRDNFWIFLVFLSTILAFWIVRDMEEIKR